MNNEAPLNGGCKNNSQQKIIIRKIFIIVVKHEKNPEKLSVAFSIFTFFEKKRKLHLNGKMKLVRKSGRAGESSVSD